MNAANTHIFQEEVNYYGIQIIITVSGGQER